MKLLLFIFSFYFLGLNVLPCGDPVEGQQSGDHIEQSHNDGHEDEHEDFCSPFCQCNCCSVTVLNIDIAGSDVAATIPIEEKPLNYYTRPRYDGFLGSILQPPQLNS